MSFREPSKDYTPFWILCLIVTSLFAAVALAEFLKWSDKNPEVRQALGIDPKP